MSAEASGETLGSGRLIVTDRFPDIPLLSQADVIGVRDGGLVDCYLPLSLINHEEVPVKDEWAASLAEQMRYRAEQRGGSGQETPLRVGWIEGEPQFRIIDGFHRDAALRINGATSIYSTAKQAGWDELYDDRIFTAKDHAHIRFARVVQWIREVWQYSGLDDKLSVKQAFVLYTFGHLSGEKLKLDPEETKAAREWVQAKEALWEITASTIHKYLHIAENVDPQLIHSTREKTSSHELTAPTQQIIEIFSKTLPGQFDHQNLVMFHAMANNLTGPKVRALCFLVKDSDYSGAVQILQSTNIDEVGASYASTKKRQMRGAADPRIKGVAALDAATKEIALVNDRVRISLSTGEPVDPEMRKKLTETLAHVESLQQQLGTLAINIAELRQKTLNDAAAQISRQSVRRAHERHNETTTINAGRKPRIRNRDVAFELPGFGKFTMEDWVCLEPHYRFALASAHPDIVNGRFATSLQLYQQLLRVAQAVPEDGMPQTKDELTLAIRPFTLFLNTLSPVGAIIGVNQDTKKPGITPAGRKHLAEVVNNAKLAVDDSRE